MGRTFGGERTARATYYIAHCEQYKLYILTLAGDIIGSFNPDPDPGFGIRSVEWHPSGYFLAVAGWDDKVTSCKILAGPYSD